MNKRLMSLVLVVLVASVLLIYDAYRNVASTYLNVSTQIESQQKKRTYLTQMYNAARERSLILLEMLPETDPFKLDDASQAMGKQATTFMLARQGFFSLALENKEIELLEQQSTLS
jgi:hypothetical protein